MLKGLRNTLSKSGSGNFAAGSGAQGASVINKSNEGAQAEPARETKDRTGDAAGKEIVPASSPPNEEEALLFEEHWTYVESLGLAKLPGEEHIVRFLADSITASPLPAPWAAHRDEEGKVFYGNASTGETTWQHPLEDVIRELAGVCRVCVSLSRSMRERSIADLRETWEAQAKQEFALWYSAKDHTTGKEYYCNSQTKQTMWEHPAEVLLPGHFLKLKSADRLLDETYLQDLANLGATLNESMGRSWNLMKRTLESDDAAATGSTEAGYKDAHNAIKEELASKTLELQSAKEHADKVKEEFESLKQRFETSQKSMSEAAERRKQLEAELLSEQQRLQSAISEVEAWKKQAMSKDGAGAEALQERVQLQVELETERQKAQQALKECEELKQQAEDLGKLSNSNEAAKSELEAKLEVERKKTQEALAECAKLNEAHSRGNLLESEKKDIEVQLLAEKQRAEHAVAQVEALKNEAHSAKTATESDASKSKQEKKEIQDQLEIEQKKTKEALAELEALKTQAKGQAAEAEAQCVELKAKIEAERKRVEQVQAECAALKSQKESAAADEAAATVKQEEQRAELQAQLKAEKETSAKALAECEKLKAQAIKDANSAFEEEKQRQALQEQLESERRRAEQASKECEMLKAQAPVELQNAIDEEQKRHEMQEQLIAERNRADNALGELAKLQKESEKVDAQVAEEEKQRKALQEQLEAERQRSSKVQEELEAERRRVKEATTECNELKAQAQVNSVKMAQVESQCKTAEERLQLERSKVEQARAECDSLKTQALLQEELLNAKTAETKAARDAGDAAQPVAGSKDLQEEMKRLQSAATRTQEAETSLHAQLKAVQDELVKEKARAEAEASKCVAARDVQEAIMQEMIAANVDKRTAEAQLQEEKKRASDFEAKYLQLQADQEAGNGGHQKEGLQQNATRLQEQLAKANLVATELEVKFNQERLMLEAANQDRRELMQRQQVSAAEAEQAEKVLQQQIRSAQEAELRLSNRAAALKALMEGERAKVEQLTEGFAMLVSKQVGGQQGQEQVENQLQELNGQMHQIRAMLRSQHDDQGGDKALNKALKEVGAANAQIQTAVSRETNAMGRSGAPEAGFKGKKGKAPPVREFHGKLWASTDDTIQTGQKVRHTRIESALVRQQMQLCKQMIEEVDSCKLAQSVKLVKSKAGLKALNSSLRDEVEKARQELQRLEEMTVNTA